MRLRLSNEIFDRHEFAQRLRHLRHDRQTTTDDDLESALAVSLAGDEAMSWNGVIASSFSEPEKAVFDLRGMFWVVGCRRK